MAKAVKLSITLSAELAEELRREVPSGSVSAYVERAVSRQLRRAMLRKLLDEQDAEYGPVDEALVRETQEMMRRLEALPDPPDQPGG